MTFSFRTQSYNKCLSLLSISCFFVFEKSITVFFMISSLSSIFNLDSLIVVGTILFGSCIGFTRPALFITVGYGLAIAGSGIAQLILIGLYLQAHSFSYMTALLVIHSIMYFVYGIRLGSYVFYREQTAAFRKDPAHKMEINIRFPNTLFMWLAVSLLYYSYSLPVLISIRSLKLGEHLNPGVHTLGLCVMAIGFLFEALGDYQKWTWKKTNPSLFCRTGLYRIVRMPNYFGELTFWLGNYLTCIGHSKSGFQILLSSIGTLFSLSLMIMASARLDRIQYERYKALDEYIDYRTSTPILFPLVPVYSLRLSSKTE